MNAEKIRRLTLGELRCRGRQRAHKLIDRVAPALAVGGVRGHIARRPGRGEEGALARFLEGAPRRFFPGPALTGTATSEIGRAHV